MYSSWRQRLEEIKQVAAAAQAGKLGADVMARQPVAPWRSTLDDTQCLLCESPTAAQACSVWLCHRIRSDLLCVWRLHAGRGKGRQTEYRPGLSPHASSRDTWPALTAKRCDAAFECDPILHLWVSCVPAGGSEVKRRGSFFHANQGHLHKTRETHLQQYPQPLHCNKMENKHTKGS